MSGLPEVISVMSFFRSVVFLVYSVWSIDLIKPVLWGGADKEKAGVCESDVGVNVSLKEWWSVLPATWRWGRTR